jgi:hypothetical protein
MPNAMPNPIRTEPATVGVTTGGTTELLTSMSRRAAPSAGDLPRRTPSGAGYGDVTLRLLPHAEQNRPEMGAAAPHERQYRGSERSGRDRRPLTIGGEG